ncbi:hypothetical protein T492DRAFT_921577 [Pavlovales sp. CCMP2436]|nr:hypothetical protein T492DRAFT_921577 [Pavlovales sp. CCMP2436]
MSGAVCCAAWTDGLGTELLELVAAHLRTAADLCSFAQVSRRFAQAVASDSVWLLAQSLDSGSKREGETYRDALKRRTVLLTASRAWAQIYVDADDDHQYTLLEEMCPHMSHLHLRYLMSITGYDDAYTDEDDDMPGEIEEDDFDELKETDEDEEEEDDIDEWAF